MRLVETCPLLNGIRVDMLLILFDHLAARLHTHFVLLLHDKLFKKFQSYLFIFLFTVKITGFLS